jgi:hypothetical protein
MVSSLKAPLFHPKRVLLLTAALTICDYTPSERSLCYLAANAFSTFSGVAGSAYTRAPQA